MQGGLEDLDRTFGTIGTIGVEEMNDIIADNIDLESMYSQHINNIGVNSQRMGIGNLIIDLITNLFSKL